MWKCKKCKEDVEDQFDVCWNCGSDRMGNVALDKEEQATFGKVKAEIAKVSQIDEVRSKYPALKTISSLYTLFALVVGVATIIFTIYFGINDDAGLVIAILALVIGSLIVLAVLAISESIMVLIDIEYNTRQKSKNK